MNVSDPAKATSETCFGEFPVRGSRMFRLAPNVSSNPVRLTAQTELGTVVWLDDQAFELAGIHDYVRKDGTPSLLFEWETVCPSCESNFRERTGSAFKPRRRCENCRKPGKPVKGKRGRKVNVRIEA